MADSFNGIYVAEKTSTGFILIDVVTKEKFTEFPEVFGKKQLAYSARTGFTMRISLRRNGDQFISWDKSNGKVKAPKKSKRTPKVEEKIDLVSQAGVSVVDEEIVKTIHDSYQLKPSYMVISEAKWKVLVRAALRGLNVILTGEAGEGKTLAAYALKDALQRPFFYVNLGNTQDAQTALIGKTHLDAATGTYFAESYFVKAIQTPNAVILLDELSRASFDAFNILITVLDKKQRYLRVSDDPNSPTIKVAPGVSFIATANVGFKYSGTVKIDHAIMDRFIKIEVDSLSAADRTSLILNTYGKQNEKIHTTLVNIAQDLYVNMTSESPMVSVAPSTRQILEMAEFIEDGFTLAETLDVILYPMYDKEERIFVKTIEQKYNEKIEDKDQLNQSDKILNPSEPPTW